MMQRKKQPGANARSEKPKPVAKAPSGKIPKSALTRKRILDAAARLFCDRAYGEVRMSDIAAAAGTQSGAMYYYFESKDALVEEFLRAGLQPMTEYLRGVVDSVPQDASFRQRIEAAIRGHLVRVLERDDYTVGFMKILDQAPAAVRERFAGYPRAYARVWRELIDGAIEAGELRKDLDASVVRNALLGSLVWSLEWYQQGKLPPEDLARQVASMFFEGMERRNRAASRSARDSAREALMATLAKCDEATLQALNGALRKLLQSSS